MSVPPFQAFLDEYRDDVYRFLVASVGRQDADDCFQETFLSAMRAYPRLRRDSNLRAWVLTIAHRKALDNHRANGRRAVPLADVPDTAAGETAAHDAVLWTEVRKLPGKQRAAVVLRFASDLSHDDIGKVLGCSEAAARRNLHEGLEKLRSTWDR